MPVRQSLRVAVAGVAVVLAATSVAHAASVAQGKKLAQSFCDECHVIVRNGPAGWTNAPSFAAIADRPTTTAASLRRFIEQPHMHMLNLGRSPAEAADLAAYILSLRQK